MHIFLSLSFILLILAQADPLYKKVVHTTDPQALCLDGTPPFLYYHQGSLSNKFLVFFNGGALCHGMSLEETISDCYNRSKTKLGSSNGWADTMTGQGILSTDQSVNDFANWTKIVIGYCDGSLHQGYRQVPISYKGQKLYFRGAVNTRSHFKWIINKFPSFKNADQVVITGASAGAIASYQWTNYVRTLVSNSSNVVTVADSGAFIISKTYEKGIDYVLTIFMNMFKLANIEQKTPLELCNAKYKDEEYKCLFIQNAWTSLQSRTLIINSQYDSENIRSHLQMNCLVKGSTQFTLTNCTQSQINFIEDYRAKFKDFMEYFMMYSKNSAWTIGCSQHVYSPRNALYNADTERVPTKTGLTVKQALNLFVFEKQRVHSEQTQPWPSNTGCAK